MSVGTIRTNSNVINIKFKEQFLLALFHEFMVIEKFATKATIFLHGVALF